MYESENSPPPSGQAFVFQFRIPFLFLLIFRIPLIRVPPAAFNPFKAALSTVFAAEAAFFPALYMEFPILEPPKYPTIPPTKPVTTASSAPITGTFIPSEAPFAAPLAFRPSGLLPRSWTSVVLEPYTCTGYAVVFPNNSS